MEILFSNWNESQQQLHSLKVWSFNAAVAAFLTVLVHYAVSEWIWFGDTGTKRRPHRAPVYLVSSCVFFYLWSAIFNKYMGHLPLGYVIATPIVGLFGGVLLNLVFCWIWTIVFPANDEDKTIEQKDDPEPEPLKQDTEAPLPTTQIETTAVPKARPKVMYINNIKIFLTTMVVLLHCTLFTLIDFSFDPSFDPADPQVFVLSVFMNSNTAYFMHLFFFFSGYFVPRSFDKKGKREFLMGRTRRLGIPLVLVAYFLEWAVRCFEAVLLWDGDLSGTNAKLVWDQSQAWFLMLLMIYGITYAFACGKGWSPKVACPTLLGFFASSIVFGLIGFVLYLCFGMNPQVMNVEQSPYILPVYTAFFFYGAVAERNNWMEDIKSKSRIAIYSWAFLAWLFMVGMTYLHLRGLGYPPLVEAVFRGIFNGGFLSVPLSLAVTVFFMDLLNKEFFFTDFFVKSMYTVYIIQYFPLAIGRYFWSLIPQAINAVRGDLLMPEVLFIATVTMIIVWPLAYAIRSIPGFSKVL